VIENEDFDLPGIWLPPHLDAKKNYLYLNRRGPLLKLGITQSIQTRYLNTQQKTGWRQVDFIGPLPRAVAVQMEASGLSRLRTLGIPDGRTILGEDFAGHSECWAAKDFSAQQVSDLFPLKNDLLHGFGVVGQEAVALGRESGGSRAQIYLFPTKSGSDADIAVKMLRLWKDLEAPLIARHFRWLIFTSPG
jgi:hypothetical protein